MIIKLTESQNKARNYFNDPKNTALLLYGGVRSGKSFTVAMNLIQRAIDYPGTAQVIFRKTMADARDTFWRETMTPFLDAAKKAGLCTVYKQPPYAEFANGSLIKLGGLHPAEIDKALGVEYSTIYVNEASEVSWQNVPILQTRLNCRKTHRETGERVTPKIIFDCNPPTTNHWLYKLFIEKVNPSSGKGLTNPQSYVSFQMNPDGNKENLSETLLAQLDSMSDRDKRRFLYGEFGQLSGLVYDCFDPEKNIIDVFPMPSDFRKFRAIDFGFTHPFVCLWIAQSHDDYLYVYKEHYATGITIDKHAEIIKRMSGSERYEKTVSDHDAGDRAVLNNAGIATVPAIKDVKSGIQLTYELIDKGRIKVFRNCTNLINEFYSYQWKESNKRDEPEKKNDHALDALRYLVASIKERPFGTGKIAWM